MHGEENFTATPGRLFCGAGAGIILIWGVKVYSTLSGLWAYPPWGVVGVVMWSINLNSFACTKMRDEERLLYIYNIYYIYIIKFFFPFPSPCCSVADHVTTLTT